MIYYRTTFQFKIIDIQSKSGNLFFKIAYLDNNMVQCNLQINIELFKNYIFFELPNYDLSLRFNPIGKLIGNKGATKE